MKDKIAEINKAMRDGINHWAYFMIMAEADQWAVNLNYDTTDLMNAVYIFQHIASRTATSTKRKPWSSGTDCESSSRT